MSMKLSRRDQVIILVVVVLIVLGVGIFCILKPKYEEVQASNSRLAAKETEKSDVEAKIATLETLKKTLEENVKAVEEDQKQFLSEEEYGDTQKISKYLMEILEPAGIEITGVNLNALAPSELSAYTYHQNVIAYDMKMNSDLAHELPEDVYYAYSNSYPAPPPKVTISSTVVTVSYKSDLECQQLFDAIQLVADHEKNIYLNTCEAVLDVEDGELAISGSLTVTVYEIQPMDPEDIDKDPATAAAAE